MLTIYSTLEPNPQFNSRGLIHIGSFRSLQAYSDSLAYEYSKEANELDTSQNYADWLETVIKGN